MSYPTYREIIETAQKNKSAVGHFNFSNVAGYRAVVEAAQEMDVPVILGVSEGERDYMGLAQAVATVKSLREELDYPIYLNADHTYSYERVVEAIDAGVDSVIFDGAKLPVEENTEITKKCVEYARNSGRDVIVEAEMGYIGSSSKVLDELPEGAAITADEMTTAEEASNFISATGIDMFAPSVGNVHGMLRSAPSNPEISIERVAEIAEATGLPLVLHGGSGITDQNIRDAVKAGITVVHISTELRLAWARATEIHQDEYPDDIAPYKVGKSTIHAMKEVVKDHLKLFK